MKSVDYRNSGTKFPASAGRRHTWSAGFTLIEIMIVVLIIGILLAIAAPNLARARAASSQKSCVSNLRKIDSAKDSYLMENNLPGSYTFSANGTEIFGSDKYIKKEPLCPANAGNHYVLGTGDQDPTCTYANTTFPHTMFLP